MKDKKRKDRLIGHIWFVIFVIYDLILFTVAFRLLVEKFVWGR